MRLRGARPATLAGRVAWSTAGAVLTAGLTVAIVSIALADRMLGAREDAHLVAAARTLALELIQPDADPAWIAVDETRELAHAAIRVAIFEGDRRIGGDASIDALAPDRCITAHLDRMCAVPAGRWTAVVARSTRGSEERRETMLVASGLAVVLTTLLGALLALWIARMVLTPLSRLRDAVERVPEDRPGSADLGENQGVAEIDALRDALRSSLGRLDAALAQARRFSRDAAHELRTPLTTILGELDLAAERLDGDERERVVRARRVAERLAALVERLLILSRPDRASQVGEELSLLDVVEAALDALPATARARIAVVTGASEPRVLGDRALLVAMATNAIENALKFSGDQVTIELALRDRHAELAVEDHGSGVAADEQGRVFAAFYRSPGARGAGIAGHGIGLALIAHVAVLHGGTATFAPCERGARLVIDLPALPPIDQPGTTSSEGPQAAGGAPTAQRSLGSRTR